MRMNRTDCPDMQKLTALMQQTGEIHKHVCPRQVLGIRMGLLAAELLQLEMPQTAKRVLAFVETDGCFADGISVASGCWLGHRTLRLVDLGKVAATFVDTRTEQAVRIFPNPAARVRAAEHCPEASSHWHAQLEAYQTMPTRELLCSYPVHITQSLKSLISRPGVRVECVRCGEEILNEREVIFSGAVVCRSCAGESYYQTAVGESPQTYDVHT